MKQIIFTYNWNNKLNCKSFTSLRVSGIYTVGDQYKVLLKEGKNIHAMGVAEVIAIREFWLHDMNEYISYLDTGYSVEQCQQIILRMHPKVDFDNVKLRLLLLKYVSKN